jgi:hypothetical protein
MENTITVIATNLPTNDEIIVDLFDSAGKHLIGKNATRQSMSMLDGSVHTIIPWVSKD